MSEIPNNWIVERKGEKASSFRSWERRTRRMDKRQELVTLTRCICVEWEEDNLFPWTFAADARERRNKNLSVWFNAYRRTNKKMNNLFPRSLAKGWSDRKIKACDLWSLQEVGRTRNSIGKIRESYMKFLIFCR